jgi:hypothetical protein
VRHKVAGRIEMALLSPNRVATRHFGDDNIGFAHDTGNEIQRVTFAAFLQVTALPDF